MSTIEGEKYKSDWKGTEVDDAVKFVRSHAVGCRENIGPDLVVAGYSVVVLTAQQWADLSTKDEHTLYFITA